MTALINSIVFDFPVGLVVGLTIGIPVVVGIGFFIVAYFCCCRKRKKTGKVGCILACYSIRYLFRKLDSRFKGCSRFSRNEANDKVANL